MIGLPGNLGNVNINELIAALKNARDVGQSALEAAAAALVSNPQIKGVVDRLRGLLGKPVIELTDEELANLIESWHKGLTAKSRDMKDEPPKPADPPLPPATGILTTDPGMQPFPANVYRSQTTPPFYLIHSGRIGDPAPSTFSPPLPNGDEPDWKILHQSVRS